MALKDTIPKPPTSPRLPQTPPGSPAYPPPDSPRVHDSSQARTIDRFEHAAKEIIRALEKVDAKDKPDMRNLPNLLYLTTSQCPYGCCL